MERKKSNLNTIILCLMVISVLIGCVALCSRGITAQAAVADSSPDAEPQGLMTKITLNIGSSGTTMWAKARNAFTLGMSTVQVYVELYSSLTYQESYLNMTLESQKYIGDLNINKTLETTAPINGVQRYWRARARYKLDSENWVYLETETHLVGIDGKVIR